MNTQEKLDFIINNQNLISETDINQLYLDLMKSKISNDFHICIDTKYLSYKLSYLYNWKMIKEQILKHFGSIAEYKIFQDFQYYTYNITSITELETKSTIETRGLTPNDLIYILYYVVNNTILENSKTPNDICDKLSIKYNDVFDWTNFDTFGDIQCKKYKNGKISFRGLAPEMKGKIKYLYNLSRKRYLNIFG